MSELFDPGTGTLIVPVRVIGPRGSHTFNCALDTGASRTVLPARGLQRLGIDLAHTAGGARMFSSTGNTRVSLIRLPAITALDRVRTDLVVAAHDMPLGLDADGLLGLDFFHGFVLRIDFARGRIDLDPPKRWWQFWRAA